MFRLYNKILQQSVNLMKNKICCRSLSNLQNQKISSCQNASYIVRASFFQINQDLKFPKSEYFSYVNNPEQNGVNTVPLPHNYNVLDYIKNYREVYIENPNPSVDMPAQHKTNEVIQAARLIVIRRRKMKKHKLRKLRKKMKFEWAKVRQRREMRKEKAFQATLINQIKEAERFSAEQYVELKLKQANEVPIPRFWKGKRLPAFIIKEKLGIK